MFIAVRIYDSLTNSLYKIGEFIYSLVSAKRIKDIFDIKEQGGSKDIQLSQFDIHFNHVSLDTIRTRLFMMSHLQHIRERLRL